MQPDVQLVWRSNDAGPVVLPAREVHRVSIHVSTTTPTRCRDTGLPFARTRGNIDITPAGMVGGFDAAHASRSLDLEISPTFLERVAERSAQSPRALALRHALRDPRITGLAWALATERQEAQPLHPLYAQSIGVALAARLLGPHLRDEPATHDATRLRHLRDYIEDNLDRRLTLDHLANVANLSNAHLSAWFKAQTGLPVHRYVVRRRVERARMLLAHGTLPLSQVALAAGFSHQTHMARWLRRELETSATSLRDSAVRTGADRHHQRNDEQ